MRAGDRGQSREDRACARGCARCSTCAGGRARAAAETSDPRLSQMPLGTRDAAEVVQQAGAARSGLATRLARARRAAASSATAGEWPSVHGDLRSAKSAIARASVCSSERGVRGCGGGSDAAAAPPRSELQSSRGRSPTSPTSSRRGRSATRRPSPISPRRAARDAGAAETLRLAGLLHDLGPLAVPNGIWDKPGRSAPRSGSGSACTRTTPSGSSRGHASSRASRRSPARTASTSTAAATTAARRRRAHRADARAGGRRRLRRR